MRSTHFMFAVLILAMVCRVLPAQSGGSYRITRSVIAGGGATVSSGGQYTLGGTIGQSQAGSTAPAGSYSLNVGFWTPPDLGPTAAAVAVSGRVRTADGSGIRNVRVRLTDITGGIRETVTGEFGLFRFDEVPTGAIYTLTVIAKRFTFADSARIINVVDEIADIEFVSEVNSLR